MHTFDRLVIFLTLSAISLIHPLSAQEEQATPAPAPAESATPAQPETPAVTPPSAEELEKRLQIFLGVKYDAGIPYPADMIKNHVAEGKVLLDAIPAQATRIKSFLEPWEKELAQMDKGLIKYRSRWIKKEDLDRAKARQEEARLKLESQAKRMEPVFFELDSVLFTRKESIIGVAVLTLSAIALVFSAIHGWSKISAHGFDLTGIIGFAFGVSLLGLYGFAFYSIASVPTGYTVAKPDPTAPQRTILDELVSYNKGDKDIAHQITSKSIVEIKGDVLSQYLVRAVHFKSADESDPWVFTRRNIQLRLSSDRIQVYQRCFFMGASLILTHTFYYTHLKEGGYQFKNWRVSLGTLKLPESLAGRFKQTFLNDLNTFSEAIGFPDTFGLLQVTQERFVLGKVGARLGESEETEENSTPSEEKPASPEPAAEVPAAAVETPAPAPAASESSAQ